MNLAHLILLFVDGNTLHALHRLFFFFFLIFLFTVAIFTFAICISLATIICVIVVSSRVFTVLYEMH